MSLQEEANSRSAHDGIPRCITKDGRIMKCDWELVSENDLTAEGLEEHIRTMLAEQSDD